VFPLRLNAIVPALTLAEALEPTRLPRVAGRTGRRPAVVTTRPFRAPHHTISDVGLIGGGQVPLPGEVSLAHHGVLFLDVWPEFRCHVLEAVRQPLEKRLTRISSPARQQPRGAGRPDGAAESLHPRILLMRNGGDRTGHRRVTPVDAMGPSCQDLFARPFRRDEYVSRPSQANRHRPLALPPLPSATERQHGGHEGSPPTAGRSLQPEISDDRDTDEKGETLLNGDSLHGTPPFAVASCDPVQ
jgi:hypothetical protein